MFIAPIGAPEARRSSVIREMSWNVSVPAGTSAIGELPPETRKSCTSPGRATWTNRRSTRPARKLPTPGIGCSPKTTGRPVREPGYPRGVTTIASRRRPTTPAAASAIAPAAFPIATMRTIPPGLTRSECGPTWIVVPRRRRFARTARAGSTAETPARKIRSASEARVIAGLERESRFDRELRQGTGEPTGEHRPDLVEFVLGTVPGREDGGEAGRRAPGAHDAKAVEPGDREKAARPRHRPDQRPTVGRRDAHSGPCSDELGVRPPREAAPEAFGEVGHEPLVAAGRVAVRVGLDALGAVAGEDPTVLLGSDVHVQVDVVDRGE